LKKNIYKVLCHKVILAKLLFLIIKNNIIIFNIYLNIIIVYVWLSCVGQSSIKVKFSYLCTCTVTFPNCNTRENLNGVLIKKIQFSFSTFF